MMSSEHVHVRWNMAWKYTRWARSSSSRTQRRVMIGKSDPDKEREQREACAPESGHIYRELDRDMGHETRAMRQR